MRLFSKLLIGLVVLILASCTAEPDKTYIPSIKALKSNETLVMKLEACHWGCTKGTVRFKNNKAHLGQRSIELTSKEIEILDQYFLKGPEIVIAQRCSLPIEISFKLKKGLGTHATKDSQIYPCSFLEISPIELVAHLKETPTEEPSWRLSQEERKKRDNLLTID